MPLNMTFWEVTGERTDGLAFELKRDAVPGTNGIGAGKHVVSDIFIHCSTGPTEAKWEVKDGQGKTHFQGLGSAELRNLDIGIPVGLSVRLTFSGAPGLIRANFTGVTTL